MRTTFSILYPADHPDKTKARTKYTPEKNAMVVMNSQGVFFIYYNYDYYPSIRKLSEVLPKYDVLWNDQIITKDMEKD